MTTRVLFQGSWPNPNSPRREKSCRKDLTEGEEASRRVAVALWKAFPEATSENNLAEIASEYFRKSDGSPVSPRTIKYWLRGDTHPSFLHTMALVRMVGASVIFGKGLGH